MKKRILSLVVLMCLMFSIVCVHASENLSGQSIPQHELTESLSQQKQTLTPEIDLKNAKVLSVRTFTQKEVDKDGVEWTDTCTEYNVSVPVKKDVNQDKASVPTLSEIPDIKASVQSWVGTDANRTYVRYYGRIYTDFEVSSQMDMALLWWTGTYYLVEAAQPTYYATGTAVATPIYVFREPTTGYWKSRNAFLCTAPQHTDAKGTAYSADLYVETY